MWIREIKSTLFTKIKYYGEKKYKGEFPSIDFTRENASNTTKFPTVYIKFLQGTTLARSLKGNKINGFQCDVEVQVTSNKTQNYSVAEDICYGLIDILVNKFSFDVTMFPIDNSNGTDTYTYVFRVSRDICFGDKL